ncbi:MAG: carboxymuconolactone decarboxylase family protein [Chloroflexi bacterium]|nr:carboxymuconolactone decarboxylase family protein [Chloroflexota bacterium]
MDEKTRTLVEQIEKERGFGMPWRRILAEYDPEFLEIFHKGMMHVASNESGLPRKTREIIQLTLSAFTSHEPGFRVHLRNALKEGATPTEIMQALELAVMSGIHAMSIMLPAMEDEIQKFRQQGPSGDGAKDAGK